MKDIAFVFGAIILLYSSMTGYPVRCCALCRFPSTKASTFVPAEGSPLLPFHFAVQGLAAVLLLSSA